MFGAWWDGGAEGWECVHVDGDRGVVRVLALGEARLWKWTVLCRGRVVARERVRVVFLSDGLFGSELGGEVSRLETGIHHRGSTLFRHWRGSRLLCPRRFHAD